MIFIFNTVALIWVHLEIIAIQNRYPLATAPITPYIILAALLLNVAWAGPAVRHYFWFVVGLLPF